MFGILIGICCGVVELYLLQRLVTSVMQGQTVPFWIPPAKMLVLAVFLIPCGFLFKDQLLAAGIATASTVLIGAIVLYVLSKRKNNLEATRHE